MSKSPIIIVDDDAEDLELIKQAFEELKIVNEIILFNDALKFLEFFRSPQNKTFLILCDINMPQMDGLELKRIIYEDESLRLKCIPFVFLSTSKAPAAVMKAYSFGVQGYFIKPTTFPKIQEMLLSIVTYWGQSQHPNYF